jgi:predicted permease
LSEILTGLTLPLHIYVIFELGYGWVALTVASLTIVSFAISFVILRYLKLSISQTERRILMISGNSRGVLGFTLALQNFNPSISSVAVVFNVTHTLVFEPIFNYYLVNCDIITYAD